MSTRRFARPLDLVGGRIDMTHGAGGRATTQLIEELFLPAFDNKFLAARNDQALLGAPAGRLVFTTDGYVVSPLFFPGGDIGCLAVNGTLNDLAMGGGVPLGLSAGFILEEGFPLRDLARIVASMATASRDAGIPIVTGDTKVVERGKGDGVFISTSGVGVVPEGLSPPSCERACPGDVVLVSGTLGDHGIALLSKREGLSFETDLLSDTAALHGLVAAMVAAVPCLHVLRDPTRGGLATTLNEIADSSGVGFRLEERQIPIHPQVAAACELLGIDPLYVANEGKLVAICSSGDAQALLDAMRRHPCGRHAAIIGTVVADEDRFVELETTFGGRRVLDWLTADQLPRIC